MQPLAEPVSNLIDAFSQLPGIGPKTATRLAYYLLRSDEAVAIKLARALEELKQRTVFCSVCFNIADQDPCAICDNQQRDHGLICVVEEPLDVQAIERTREFTGVYHVLHGAISPVEGVGPEDLKVGELLQRIQQSETPVRELLLATNPNLEGEATAMYIARLTKPLGLRVTRLARGLPMGGDLEYADEMTLGRALTGRSEM
ncbi:MAG: recombination mediator RecR [Caldilinea sp.]|nr:recombination protein RecR [Caldilinea sp.]MCB0068840.1 recombination protein RecR [Caldilineaceae bacterium]MCB0040988.1 recombination protein RecR [Caldilinea sp.]MCB0054848.1 recombination protein RecR [Caldilinea sp.]MCB0151969.1 recombination protein RecR [Caldilineaceae bacterium]